MTNQEITDQERARAVCAAIDVVLAYRNESREALEAIIEVQDPSTLVLGLTELSSTLANLVARGFGNGMDADDVLVTVSGVRTAFVEPQG